MSSRSVFIQQRQMIMTGGKPGVFIALFIIALALHLSGSALKAASITWDGGGTDNNWNTANNWNPNGNPAGNDFLAFGGTTRLTTTNNFGVGTNFNGLTFNNGAGAFVLWGNGINLGGGVTNADDSLQTINLNLAMTGTRTFTVSSSGNLLVNGVVSGAFGLNKNGTGTGALVLAGSNTFTGTTTINQGRLQAANNDALGTTAAGTTIAAGAALELTGDIAIGAETLSLSGDGISSGGALRNVSGDNSWAGTITVADVAAVHQINSDSGTLTIGGDIGETGANNKTLTFGGAGNVTVNGNITASAGDMVLTKEGNGTLTLAGTNTYDGATTISAGALRAANNTALGTIAGGVTVASGAALELDGGITIGAEALSSLAGTGISGGGALRNISGSNTYGGAITLANVASLRINSDAGTLALSGNISESGNTAKTLALGGAGNITITGTLSDSGNDLALLKDGTGTLKLSGANSIDNGVTIAGGVLWMNNANALGSGNLNLTNSGVLGLGTGNFTRSLGTGNGQVQFTGNGGFAAYGADRVVSIGSGTALTWNSTADFLATGEALVLGASDADGMITFSNNVSFNGAARTVQVNDGSSDVDATLRGVLSGTGNSGLTKTGTGTLKLTGANTYAGVTTINGGIVNVTNLTAGGSSGGLGISSSAATNVILNGGTLQYAGGAVTNDRLFSVGTSGGTLDASGTGALSLTNTGAMGFNSQTGARTLTLTGTNTGNNTLAAAIGDNTGATALSKTGSGTWVLTRSNSFTGTTTVSAGKLKIQNSNALGTTAGSTTISGTGGVQVDGAGLNIAEAATVSSTGSGAGGIQNLANTNTWSGALTVSSSGRINSDAGNLNLTGGVSGGGDVSFGGAGDVTVATTGISGSGTSVTKDGNGTLNLNVANTYTGGTILSAGTIKLGANNALGGSGSAFNFAGGILNANNFSFGIGQLTLSVSSDLILGSGSQTLTFASATRTGGDLTVYGWVGGAGSQGTQNRIIFQANPNATFTGHVNFDGFASGATTIDLGGGLYELAPVPEPTTWALIIFVAIVVLWKVRSIFRRKKTPLLLSIPRKPLF